MINHARTMLLNMESTAAINETVGAEYVPADFTPVVETTEVKAARSILFGSLTADMFTMNYRLHQYMNLLHANPFVGGDVLALDTRITYANRKFWYDFNFGTTTKTIIKPRFGLSVLGNFEGNDKTGINHKYFTVESYTDGTARIIRVKSFKPQYTDTLHRLTLGENTAIKLGEDTKLAVSFPNIELFSHWGEGFWNDDHWIQNHWMANSDVNIDGMWTISGYAKPARTLPEIDIELNKAGMYSASFGLEDKEPYRTYLSLMKDKYKLQNRLCGLLMSVISSNNLRYNEQQ